jgi:hypothetical protein
MAMLLRLERLACCWPAGMLAIYAKRGGVVSG